MQPLLTAIVTWLSINLGLPATYEHPRIERVSPAKMNVVLLRGRMAGQSRGVMAGLGHLERGDSGRNVEAVYDDASRTIYLQESWTGATPAELSVLVHEMVHHLQNVAGLKYDCPQAREKPAYAAQEKWLAMFGRDLMEEFKLDPMTLLVRTGCMH